MANFPTKKSLNYTIVATATEETLTNLTYKADFYIQAANDNADNIELIMGDNNIVIRELAPGETFDVSSNVVSIFTSLKSDIPFKVKGTLGDQIIGFKGV